MSLSDQTIDAQVCVVTVTYGNRWQYLRQVLQAVMEDKLVGRIVVVDNGTAYDLAFCISGLGCSRISIVRMGDNVGSAAGYKAGIQRALEDSGSSLIWLLDDDNCPAPGALSHLLKAQKRLRSTCSHDRLAVLALREDRPQLAAVARGQSVAVAFPARSSFLGFHLWRTVWRKFRKIAGVDHKIGNLRESVPIPFGIYGGLLFHRDLIGRIGYPDERFFLYGDDTDFTLRITNCGGALYLIPAARVTDLESSWHVAPQRSIAPFLKNCTEASETRLYYSMRNGAYLCHRYHDSHSIMYRLNRQLYLAILKLYLSHAREPQRYRLIVNAIMEGEAGQLGRNRDLPGIGKVGVAVGEQPQGVTV